MVCLHGVARDTGPSSLANGGRRRNIKTCPGAPIGKKGLKLVFVALHTQEGSVGRSVGRSVVVETASLLLVLKTLIALS
jgi:hypothetical protein